MIDVMKASFEEAYHRRYNSRVLQWAFEESEFVLAMTLPQGSVDLKVTFDQMLILNAFNVVSDLTFNQLEDQTKLPTSRLRTAVKQLCSDHAGPLLIVRNGSIDEDSASLSFNDNPSIPKTGLNLVPVTPLTIHTPVAAPVQDMTVLHRTKVDAAIVRIMKKDKFLHYSDLFAQLSAVLDFLPEVGNRE